MTSERSHDLAARPRGWYIATCFCLVWATIRTALLEAWSRHEVE